MGRLKLWGGRGGGGDYGEVRRLGGGGDYIEGGRRRDNFEASRGGRENYEDPYGRLMFQQGQRRPSQPQLIQQRSQSHTQGKKIVYTDRYVSSMTMFLFSAK